MVKDEITGLVSKHLWSILRNCINIYLEELRKTSKLPPSLTSVRNEIRIRDLSDTKNEY